MLFCDFDLINESCERKCKMTKGYVMSVISLCHEKTVPAGAGTEEQTKAN
ncbi:Uncharacterised protein [Salmonella enterica subsp. enterica serovar Madelia]|nr:Uncharacterised protein [Salmonella enterica subsp. enterica serovar Madelia]